jgi:hypothetical protein
MKKTIILLNLNIAQYPFRFNSHWHQEYHVSNAQCKNQILVDACSVGLDISASIGKMKERWIETNSWKIGTVWSKVFWNYARKTHKLWQTCNRLATSLI